MRAPTLHLAAHPAPHPARRRRLGSLNDNAIGDEGAVALAEALESNCVLSTLNLARNDIGGDVSARPPQSDPPLLEGAPVVQEACRHRPRSVSAVVLICVCSHFRQGALAIEGALKRNSVLTRLNLKGNSFDAKAARAMQEEAARKSQKREGEPDGSDWGILPSMQRVRAWFGWGTDPLG